jgi:hypothetical protein
LLLIHDFPHNFGFFGLVAHCNIGYKSHKKDADGKLSATTVHFGSKKKETSDAGGSTNSVSK